MEHLVELGPESLLEGGIDGTQRENNKFWFGATWDSERKEYFTDETGELLNGVADGLDKVKFGVLLSLDKIEDKWSSVVLAETDNSKAGFRISFVVTIARALSIQDHHRNPSKHMLLCFDRETCLNDGYPMYDAKECKVVLSYVQISELSDSPCDKEHFLAFATNETEQQMLLHFIYGRKIQKYGFLKTGLEDSFSRI